MRSSTAGGAMRSLVEIEFVAADGPTSGSAIGLAGLEAGARSFLSAWEEYRIEAAEYRELDGERI